MLITPEIDRRNKNLAVAAMITTAILSLFAGWFWLPALFLIVLCPLIYWLIRRNTLHRSKIMNEPFTEAWEHILVSHVAFFRALNDSDKKRFRQIVKVFLDEVRITGIGTDIDEKIRVLVAASAVIPIFGFHDWDYHRLGEVLIYPDSFGKEYQASKREDSNILGLTGLHQLRGIMILSKPSLLAGFDGTTPGDNVGVHEFAHLIEVEENESGLPPEVPWGAVKHWVEYVAKELSHPENIPDVRSYAYTNEHEFFAVLSEYFFKSPDLLKKKDPELYKIMRDLFHQDTAALLQLRKPRRLKYRSNAICPCGSGEKYKNCCLQIATETKTAKPSNR